MSRVANQYSAPLELGNRSEMKYCLSLLCPAFATKSKGTIPDFAELCSANMGITRPDDIEFFKLVKYDPNLRDSEDAEFIEIAIRVKNSEFSMKTIENMIQQNERLQEQIEKMKEAMNSYSSNIRDSIGGTASSLENQLPDNLREELEKKESKIKRLEEANKKLKQLVKTQHEKSEMLRKDTHNTVEKLREEFDFMVREFINFK